MSSQKQKLAPKPTTGKVVHTEKGTANWQFAADHDDTQRILKALSADELTLEESPTKTGPTPFNPYDKTTLAPTNQKPRRSLDDLRKLSEEIKKSKQYVRSPKGTGK